MRRCKVTNPSSLRKAQRIRYFNSWTNQNSAAVIQAKAIVIKDLYLSSLTWYARYSVVLKPYRAKLNLVLEKIIDPADILRHVCINPEISIPAILPRSKRNNSMQIVPFTASFLEWQRTTRISLTRISSFTGFPTTTNPKKTDGYRSKVQLRSNNSVLRSAAVALAFWHALEAYDISGQVAPTRIDDLLDRINRKHSHNTL